MGYIVIISCFVKICDMSHTIYRIFVYHLFHSNTSDKEKRISMDVKEAVEKRILELCQQNNIAVNALANISGVSPSTIYSMLNEKSKNPGVVSIKKICDGLGITIREFFNSDLFDNLEQEIK